MTRRHPHVLPEVHGFPLGETRRVERDQAVDGEGKKQVYGDRDGEHEHGGGQAAGRRKRGGHQGSPSRDAATDTRVTPASRT